VGEFRETEDQVFPHNPLLSDHNLITFEFILPGCTPLIKSFYTRCLTDSAVAKFKEAIPSAFDSVPRVNITEDSWSNFSPSQIDHLVDSATGSLSETGYDSPSEEEDGEAEEVCSLV